MVPAAPFAWPSATQTLTLPCWARAAAHLGMAAEATRAAPGPADAADELAAKAALVMASPATAVPATTTARRPARERWYFMTVSCDALGSLLCADPAALKTEMTD